LDTIVSIGDRIGKPEEQPMFPMGVDLPICVRRGLDEFRFVLSIPRPRSRKQPYAEPQAVTWKVLDDQVGYLKVAILPGLLGLDVAREIDYAIAQLSCCERLILDLRGHLGGGLGVLRLMSNLTPESLPIGYTVTRKRAERGYDKTELRRLDKLPTELSNPLAIAKMAVGFAGRDPSVALIAEGLGPKPWHGRVVVLINEHTVSAGEMVAAFAAENKLAKLVGTETAGRLIPGSGFEVGYGYMLIMPKAQYITWQEQRFEGRGVIPDVSAPWKIEDIQHKRDGQLEIGFKVVQSI
jgi:C-terminal processing protease CtpA/Prc